MSNNKPVIVSVVLAVILLLAVAAFAMLMQIILMNGVMSSSQTSTALGVSLGCQGVTLVLGVLFARWLTRWLIVRFQWNATLAVIVNLAIVAIAGGILSFAAIFISLAVAGIV